MGRGDDGESSANIDCVGAESVATMWVRSNLLGYLVPQSITPHTQDRNIGVKTQTNEMLDWESPQAKDPGDRDGFFVFVYGIVLLNESQSKK